VLNTAPQVIDREYIHEILREPRPGFSMDEALVVLTQVYLDESGIGGDTGHVVLAGYQATKAVWLEFWLEWQRALAEAPAIGSLHTRDANRLRGDFDGLAPGDRDAKLERLVDVIRDHGLVGRAAHVRIEHYELCLRGVLQPEVDHPLYPAFLLAMASNMSAMWRLGSRRLDVCFDNHERHAPLMAFAWDSMRVQVAERLRHLLGTAQIASGAVDFPPIQAADLLAWHVHRSLTRPDEDRPIFAMLKEGQDVEVLEVDRSYLIGVQRQARALQKRRRRGRS